MRVVVDLKLCQGYANCADAAPTVFDLDDAGKVVLLQEEPPADLHHDTREAARLCPVKAIVVEDQE